MCGAEGANETLSRYIRINPDAAQARNPLPKGEGDNMLRPTSPSEDSASLNPFPRAHSV